MKLLHRGKKIVNVGTLTELDYSVLNYDQLLKVNGAKGSSSQGSASGNTGGANTNNEPSSSNTIDNSKNPTIVGKFTDSGYEYLSDKPDSTYTAGSRKDYIQSEFDMMSSDSESFTVITQEAQFEGVSNGENSYTDYNVITVLTKDGRTVLEGIDINGDSTIDLVK